ncbi:MAG: hypothetical protein VB092_08090 [Oscillospiraceae bacterium]|nr:hypothetical protein [Oscillospiraceae bacterium]
MELNGSVMSRDTEVAKVENGDIVSFDESRLPLYLRRTKDVTGWLASRAIDAHRTNSRLLKRALRIRSSDDLETVLRVNAATITDAYWFREQGSALTYADVVFKENLFDKLALYGDADSFNNPYSPTPELTNTGSFEKCWRLIDGKWWMYKSGNENERFSELFIYEFGTRLGIPMARYEADGGYIRSLDFTDGAKLNFEPASSVMGDNEDYAANFAAFQGFGSDIARRYVEMLYLDTLCFNMDRHTQNYGVLRDPDSGDVVSFAPLFDHNIALISRGYPKIERQNDKLVELFADFLKAAPEAMELFKGMDFPTIDDSFILKCCDAVPIKANREFIVDFIINGKRQLDERIEQQQDFGQQIK